MGLTNSSVGIKAVDSGLEIKKNLPQDKVIALAGNPNVGKSTVFNGLTGMNQHTGNWPGKTVANAQGYCAGKNQSYVLVDIPGTYSLMAHSAEEQVARDFICFGDPDAVVVVCDATCLERNLNLVLQTIEISSRVVVCINLMDEAKRKSIKLDLGILSKRLGVPVVGTTARKKKSLNSLLETLDGVIETCSTPYSLRYDEAVEEAIAMLEEAVAQKYESKLNGRWLSLQLLDQDPDIIAHISDYIGVDLVHDCALEAAISKAKAHLALNGIDSADKLKDIIVSALVSSSEELCKGAVTYENREYAKIDRNLSQGSILELDSLSQMKSLFVSNGWTWITAVSVMLFSLNHWPCSTTLLTIKKETGSWKWTALAAAIPTVTGVFMCIAFTALARLFTA